VIAGPGDARCSRFRDLSLGAVLFLGTVLLFLPTTRHWFISYDDQHYVYANPHVQAGLRWSTFLWAFTTFHAANWHPLTWLSHALDCQLFGLLPGRHHLTSVLIHAANAVLLFALLRYCTGRAWTSAVAAALFAWHPLRVESVAWVAERKDVLCGFFFLVSLLFYSSNARRRSRWKIGALYATFVCALLAKPMVVTLPVVLLLWDYWPLNRLAKIGRLIVEKIPLFVLSVASSIVTVIAQRAGGAVSPIGSSADVAKRGLLALHSIAWYLLKEIWPVKLSVLYLFRDDPVVQIAPAATAVVAISAIVIIRRGKDPRLFAGWIWFVVMLLPVLGIVRVGEQSMADRYTYLPAIGLAIIAAGFLGDCAERLPGSWRLGSPLPVARERDRVRVISSTNGTEIPNHPHPCPLPGYRERERCVAIAVESASPCRSSTAILVSALLLIGCCITTLRQIANWYDTRSVFAASVAALGPSALADSMIPQGRLEAAERDYLALPGGPAAGWRAGDSADALLRRLTLEQRREYFEIAAGLIPGPARPHAELARTFASEGDHFNATAQLLAAVNIDPDDADAQLALAKSLALLRRYPDALAHAGKALELRPGDPDAVRVVAKCQELLSKAQLDR